MGEGSVGIASALGAWARTQSTPQSPVSRFKIGTQNGIVSDVTTCVHTGIVVGKCVRSIGAMEGGARR
jgi:hypothetical protein